ncbi:MAG TPA: DUF885 domain-containing protein [Nocardioidaceae bacterium]|nr:DUF885 domain-containing protein [Nocardioidaceae bacterium]
MTDTAQTLDQLAEEYYSAWLAVSPTEAHLLGEYQYAGGFEQATRAEEDRRVAELREFARRAQALPEEGLSEQQRITRAVIVDHATSTADLAESRLPEISADPIFGEQTAMPLVVGMLSLPDAEVAEAMVRTFHGLGRYFGDLAERLREGAERGRFPARFAVEATIEQIEESLGRPAGEDPLLNTQEPPEGVDVAGWRGALQDAIEKSVRPGLETYRDALRDVALPNARPDDKVGLCWLPGGDDAYTKALRYFTTTDKTAQEIHDIGLAQIDKLAEEYRGLGPEVVGTDDLSEIFDAMRSDPKLHFEHADQLVEASEVAMQRAWEAIPNWFEVLPKAKCAVQSTLTGAKAFYFPPATDGRRGGTFFVNVKDVTAWGVFELESLAFHEGIPGHHLQLAIASELESVPEFRKHLHNSAYAEGWGLYSERLADEMGLYSAAVDRMGMYSADSMRACRLVVDTGMHALGWSRQQAVDYMVANSPMTEAICRPEVDRYVVSPGQACSYMVGRLEIQRMRREAEQRQGDTFDVKKFHSAVLDSGSLPLGILEEVVTARLGQ